MSHRAHLLLPPAAAALALALAALPGCQNNDSGYNRTSRTSSSMSTSNATTSSMRDTRSTRAMNERTADDLLREAEQSEREGKYEHAMEVYQYLRGFPEPSRPNDLEQRIDRVRTRMQQTGQR